ncbi:MAG: CotH kinase family protein [Oscillospiraceae bacterium]
MEHQQGNLGGGEFRSDPGVQKFASGGYQGAGEIKGRGNTSWQDPKKPYSLKLGSKKSLLDIPATKKYAIVPSYGDASMLRNYITYKSGLKLDGIEYTPKTEFVDVYLNGQYNGVYILVERIDIEKTKVNIEEANETNITGGYIIEKDAGDKVNKQKDPWFNAPFQANPSEDLFTLKAPDPDDKALLADMLSYLEGYMQQVHDAIMDPSEDAYKRYVDTDSWVDFLIMQELSKNIDGNLKTSCYFYKEADNDTLRMTALWDFDNAYGNANWDNKSPNNDQWDCPSGLGTSDFMVINSSCPWFKTLYGKPEFQQKVKETYTKYRYTLIEDMRQMIGEQGAYLAKAVKSDPYTYEYKYTNGVRTLNSWLKGRVQWLDSQWLLDTPRPTQSPFRCREKAQLTRKPCLWRMAAPRRSRSGRIGTGQWSKCPLTARRYSIWLRTMCSQHRSSHPTRKLSLRCRTIRRRTRAALT